MEVKNQILKTEKAIERFQSINIENLLYNRNIEELKKLLDLLKNEQISSLSREFKRLRNVNEAGKIISQGKRIMRSIFNHINEMINYNNKIIKLYKNEL